MELWTIGITGLALLCLGPLLILLGLRYFTKENDISSRINQYISEPLEPSNKRNKKDEERLLTRELTGTLASRVVVPRLKWIGRQLGRLTPKGAINDLAMQLTIAGNPMRLEAREFYGLRLGFIGLAAWIGYIVISRDKKPMNILLGIAVAILIYYMPILWLRGRMRQRQELVRRGFPDALDMLSVCASAGLGFDQALQRVAEHWQTPVGIEFGRINTEMNMGLSRAEALRNMANRVNVSEISSFVSFILQTEQLGLSVADTLHGQAEQLRIARRLRAQEQAQKVPTKMLIPMAFLIFPAIMAIILGPAIPELMSFFSTMTR